MLQPPVIHQGRSKPAMNSATSAGRSGSQSPYQRLSSAGGSGHAVGGWGEGGSDAGNGSTPPHVTGRTEETRAHEGWTISSRSEEKFSGSPRPVSHRGPFPVRRPEERR